MVEGEGGEIGEVRGIGMGVRRARGDCGCAGRQTGVSVVLPERWICGVLGMAGR